MVGSTLESEYGLASGEMKEIVSALSENTGTVDLEVAFGGSHVDGWSGMTIANLEELKADIADGKIGNGRKYSFQDENLNMGDSSGLFAFLDYLMGLPSHDRNILIFWDHGASYGGVCFDEKYSMDALSLTEVRDTLKETDISWDLIGMDACLMGAMEVISAVHESADLLLVSEEVIPGHGWDYQIPLRILVQYPDISMEEWGKIVIDAYMDNPSHEKMKKTLSLIDLTKAKEIEGTLTELGNYLGFGLKSDSIYRGIALSYYNAQKFGYDPKRDVEVSVDLADFADNVAKNIPGAGEIISELNQSIVSSVLYHKNDGSRPKSNGISTFSPIHRTYEEIKQFTSSNISEYEWSHFLESYGAQISDDKQRPVIYNSGNNTYQIYDEKGLENVYVTTDWLPDVTNFYHTYGLKAEPVYPDEHGLYTPNPDDKTFYIIDTNSKNRSLFFYTYFGEDLFGNQMYLGFLNVTRNLKTREVQISFVVDKTGNTTYSMWPYEENPNTGEIISARVPLTLRQGDIITPVIVERFLEGEPRWQYTSLPPLPMTGELKIVKDTLPYGAFYPVLWAYDYNQNYDLALLPSLRYPNTARVAEIPESS